MSSKQKGSYSRMPYTVAAQERYLDKIEISKVTANPTTEPDIYEWLVSRENKSGAIKELITQEIIRVRRKEKTSAKSASKTDEALDENNEKTLS